MCSKDNGRTVITGEALSYSADRECVQSAQSIDIARLLRKSGKDYIQMSENQYGVTLRFNGCLGHIRFTNSHYINIVQKYDGLKMYDNREIDLVMLSQVFGLDMASKVDNLMEFFFRLFLMEVSELTKRGLRSEYQKIRKNGTQFRGRVLFNENIRNNYVHKERIFVEYTKYTLDRVENRLIKKALTVVGKFTADPYNKAIVMALLKYFEDVEVSERPKIDYSAVKITKDSEDYIMPLRWANTILNDMELTENIAMKKPVVVIMDNVDLISAYIACKSIKGRKGRYQYDFNVEKIKGPSSTDPIILQIKPKWSFFDKNTGREINDPTYLFNTASGYAVMPSYIDSDYRGERRLAFMAEQYLTTDLLEQRRKRSYLGTKQEHEGIIC